MTVSRFTFTGFGLPAGEDPLGIWELDAFQTTAFAAPAGDAATAGDAAAGALGSCVAEKWLIWQVELPASRREAKRELNAHLASVKLRLADLEAAEMRLVGLDMGFAYGTQTAGPESALLADVMALRGSAAAYGAGGAGTISFLHLYEQCEALVARFRQLVQYYARVETRVGGQPVGLTVVDWSGDYDVTWQDGVGPSDMALHMDSVRLALASRQAWLRLVSVVASGALSLSVKAAVPGGQFLLFPAVYKFVRDVLAELEQIKVHQETPG